jgi:hypothetical protein
MTSMDSARIGAQIGSSAILYRALFPTPIVCLDFEDDKRETNHKDHERGNRKPDHQKSFSSRIRRYARLFILTT